MKTPLLRIERSTHTDGLFGSGRVTHGWLANTTPDRRPGATPAVWLGYREGATPAEALSGLDVPDGLAELLDHPRLWGLMPSNCTVKAPGWMCGYFAPWFGRENGQVLWVYAGTPDGAVQAALAEMERSR